MRNTKATLVILAVFFVGIVSLSSPLQRGFGAGGIGNPTPLSNLLAGPGTVEGIVQRFDNKEPIADVEITLVGPQTQGTAVTNAAGRFAFAGIATGTYSVRAQRRGYFRPGLTGPAPLVTAQATITDAQPKTTVALALAPGAIVSGRVTDSEGNGLASVRVDVTDPGISNSGQLSLLGTTTTNGRGEFRITDVEPGRHYVRAMVQATGAPSSRPTVPYLATFFASATDLRSASMVTMASATEVVADIQMMKGASRSITGRLVPADPTETINLVRFFLVSPEAGLGVDTGLPAGVNSILRGEFRLEATRPGLYDLIAATPSQAGSSVSFGRTPVDLREKDATGVTIPMGPTFSLEVRFSTAANTGAQALSPPILALVPAGHSLPSFLLPRTAGTARGNPTQVFNSVPEGRYALSPGVFSSEFSVVEMRQGSRNILEDGIIAVDRVSPAVVEVVLSERGGTIQGSIDGAGTKSLAGAYVVAVPEGTRRTNLFLYRRMVLGGPRSMSGEFRLAPGRYNVFALENVPSGSEQDTEFLKSYERFGRSVEVTAGSVIRGIVVPLARP